MATQAQIQANRLNAQKSTGPRTEEGKAVVSQNALKHGLCAEKAVIAGEDLGEFEFYRDQMLGDLAPTGAVEAMVAERVVSLSWRLRRAERAQNEAFDALLAKDAASSLPRRKESLPTGDGSDVAVEETPLGRAVVRDFTNGRVLDRLSMYERRIEYSLYKTMGEFKKLRLMREIEPGAEKPPQPNNRWGKPHPTCAVEPDCAAAEQPCKTNPIAGDADGPEQGQTLPEDAKQSQSADPAGTATETNRAKQSQFGNPAGAAPGPNRAKQSQCAGLTGAVPGLDRAKQTQSAAARTNLPWQRGVCEPMPGMQNKPNFPGRRFDAAHGCAGHNLKPPTRRALSKAVENCR